jgi:hypothetical protein
MTTAQTGSPDSSSGVQLSEVVAAIALAADLGLGQPLEHVLRSCVIATRFAEHLGASPEDRYATYWVTLFITAGCTGVSFELSRVFGDDIEFRAGMFNVGSSNLDVLRYVMGRAGSGRGVLGKAKVRADLLRTRMSPIEESLLAHSGVSAQLAERLGLGESVVTSLRQTFARWDGKGLPRGLGGDDIRLPIRIGNLANLVEVSERERGIDAAFDTVREFSGTQFDPRLVDAWCATAGEVLEGLHSESSWDRVVAGQPATRGPLTEAELDDALELLGDYADLKSPYLTGHSRGVASLAVAAAGHARLSEGEVTTLRRAAFIHDLGPQRRAQHDLGQARSAHRSGDGAGAVARLLHRPCAPPCEPARAAGRGRAGRARTEQRHRLSAWHCRRDDPAPRAGPRGGRRVPRDAGGPRAPAGAHARRRRRRAATRRARGRARRCVGRRGCSQPPGIWCDARRVLRRG